jgi:hypothetical protein
MGLFVYIDFKSLKLIKYSINPYDWRIGGIGGLGDWRK